MFSTVRVRIQLVALYAVIMLPFIIWGAAQALRANNNSPIDWVGSDFSARAVYDHFTEHFGPGDAVIMSWDSCRLDEPRLDALMQTFRDDPRFRDAHGKSWFYRVVNGRETVRHMTSSPEIPPGEVEPPGASDAQRFRIPAETAIERLKGTLIGPDGVTTCVILVFSREGLDQRAHVVRLIEQEVESQFSVSGDDLHLAGPIIDGLTVDAASQQSLASFALPSSVVIFVICWLSLRSFRGALLVFGTAAWCQGACLAIIHYSGETLSSLLIVIPPLIQVLAVAGGIHLMNYYFESLPYMTPQEAAVNCFRQGWLPCTLSAATTAMGTASLMISGLEPIRLFGAHATIGVLLTASAVMTTVPCGMILCPVTRRIKGLPDGIATQMPDDAQRIPVHTDQISDIWLSLRNFLQRYNMASLCFLLGLIVASGAGLSSLQTSVRIETLFDTDQKILRDYRWLEERIGPLIPVEVLLTFDESCPLNSRQQMDRLFRADKALRTVTHISGTTSALTYFPKLPAMQSVPERMRLAVVNRAIEAALPMFEQAEMLKETDDGRVWRVTAHCSAIEPLDYGELLADIDRAVREITLAKDGKPTVGMTISTSGIMPLVHQIQGQLLHDLFDSLVSALVVITLTMTLVEAGIRNGILSMMSNIFPIVLMFGTMGWLAVPMDIGSVMTASIALGIAVDDTLHYLTFFRRSLETGRSRPEAVLFAYRHCGRAMIQTSVTCALGLLTFGLSDFAPTSRFAVMMVGLLTLALLGDLLLLPALLLSPFGAVFDRGEE